MSRLTSHFVARIQSTKPCSDGTSPRLVIEREIEKFIERVGCFMAEPGEKLLAAVLGAEEWA